MANLSIHPNSSEPVERGTRVGGPQSPVGAILQRLSREFSGPAETGTPAESADGANAFAPATRSSLAFLSRCIVLQAVGLAGTALNRATAAVRRLFAVMDTPPVTALAPVHPVALPDPPGASRDGAAPSASRRRPVTS